jgi:spoIIIJ-associated protein
MADNDLDKYLEDIGIDMEEESEPQFLEAVEVDEPFTIPSGVRVEGDAAERCESFLVNLLLNFDPAYAVELSRVEEDRIEVEVFGGDPGKIIGRNGRTLHALEYVTNAVMNREEGQNVRVNIDVGGYKRRRDERLRDQARRVSGEVQKTGESVELEPMSAAERRVIHLVLADDPYVKSESTGEGRNRRVVIKPETQEDS